MAPERGLAIAYRLTQLGDEGASLGTTPSAPNVHMVALISGVFSALESGELVNAREGIRAMLGIR